MQNTDHEGMVWVYGGVYNARTNKYLDYERQMFKVRNHRTWGTLFEVFKDTTDAPDNPFKPLFGVATGVDFSGANEVVDIIPL